MTEKEAMDKVIKFLINIATELQETLRQRDEEISLLKRKAAALAKLKEIADAMPPPPTFNYRKHQLAMLYHDTSLPVWIVVERLMVEHDMKREEAIEYLQRATERDVAGEYHNSRRRRLAQLKAIRNKRHR